ncbi:eight-cysteine-cluster domain-containing protein [Candidatus Woesearchaeota archaeon]|nr:eight-cysteine-cluster domain-containing protein [Candidatus Woesearchaeota archaeon]
MENQKKILFILALISALVLASCAPGDLPGVDGPNNKKGTDSGPDISKKPAGAECSQAQDCTTGGCSGNLCVSKKAGPVFSTCEYLPEYECYSMITCGCVQGKCGWEETEDFKSCVAEKRSEGGGAGREIIA